MTTVNVPLPDQMKDFVEAQARREGFGTVGEYLQMLILEAQKVAAKQALEAKLREGVESGLAPPPGPAGMGCDREGRPRIGGVEAAARVVIGVRQTLRARRDLVETIAHLAGRSEDAARRFRVEARATFERLAALPGLGARYRPNDPAYADLRYFPVSKFRNHIVFDRARDGGIEVVRVLHGAMDLDAVLAEEFGISGEDAEPAR